MAITYKINRSDILGASASALCAIHCTLSPLLFALKPVLESTNGNHSHTAGCWAALDYIFLVISLVAVWYSARHTNHSNIKWILWAAWGLFAFGLLSEPFDLSFGKWLMYGGSFTLFITHWKNYQLCQKSNHINCQQ